MDRAPTWLHLTLGGSPGARLSSTWTEMPRQARSIARVNPTGPPPAISTFVTICFTAPTPLIGGTLPGSGNRRKGSHPSTGKPDFRRVPIERVAEIGHVLRRGFALRARSRRGRSIRNRGAIRDTGKLRLACVDEQERQIRRTIWPITL